MQLTTWKGQHSILLNKIYNENGYVYDSDIINVLVYKCLNENKYISDDEAKLLFLKKYFSEVDNKITADYSCPLCTIPNEVEFDINDIVFKDIELNPIDFKIGNDNITICFKNDLSNDETLELINKTKNMLTHEKQLLELYYRVDKILVNGEQLEGNNVYFENYFENIPIKYFNDVLNLFQDMLPKCKLIKKCTCNNCNEEVNVELNEIPDSVKRSLF